MLQFQFVSESSQTEALTACVEACVAYKHLMQRLRDIPNDKLADECRSALIAMDKSWSVLSDAYQDLNSAMLRSTSHNDPLAVIEVMLLHACVRELASFVGQAHVCCEPLIADAKRIA